MPQEHEGSNGPATPNMTVRFTDVVNAMVAPLPVAPLPVAPLPVGPVHPARSGLMLRPIDPADHDLPEHDNVAHEIVVMKDFAGELRRWLASQTK